VDLHFKGVRMEICGYGVLRNPGEMVVLREARGGG
jgi:hypothetical protein